MIKAIVLAAGKGTRMNSDLIKVAHKVGGKPIINHVLDTLKGMSELTEIFIVVGHQADTVKALTNGPNVSFVEQKEQLGTGHAVIQVAPTISLTNSDLVIIIAGDCPLISETSLNTLIATHNRANAKGTVLTIQLDEPARYGRILKDEDGNVLAIREAKDCTPQELKIKEVNSGVYCFHGKSLFNALSHLSTDNSQGEYYLTDVLEILRRNGDKIAAYCTPNSDEALGVNTPEDLAQIEAILENHTQKT
ncbi:MAG: NTP transferase domain-containing protein [bacterium]|nr:NTP transferase domain-containing protein [bacterium]